MNEIITQINEALWSYLLIGALVICGLWFSFKTKGVQFRMVGEMFRLLTESAASVTNDTNDKYNKYQHISSFQEYLFS